MARKEPKRKRVSKRYKEVCTKRRKEIIVETIIVLVIIALFVCGVTKIVLDEVHGSTPRYTAEISPSSFSHIVTKSDVKNYI